MNKEDLLTVEKLRSLLDYEPTTGVFTWRSKVAKKIVVGSVAGNLHPLGYRRIRIDGRQYFEHRLAWLYVTGSWPKLKIDHINRVKTDNRFENLRDVSVSINNQNTDKQKRNTSGVKGVTWNASSAKWQAQIRANAKHHYLGVYKNIQDAENAYLNGVKKFHSIDGVSL
tara:strand:+ start:103 stop:609 length:507 start_codon:yes stop_codon:yes gene_type:complete